MSQISKRLLLGLGAACLIMESVLIMPASAGDSVSLFKVIMEVFRGLQVGRPAA
jgi:hypothetical protein